MKKVCLITLIMILALSTFAWAASGKIDVNVTPTDSKSFVLSNEAAGYFITELINAGYGSYSLYDALVVIQALSDPSVSGIITDAFLATLAQSPAGSEVFTTRLRDVTGTSIAINDDGTAQIVDIQGRDYYGQAGFVTLGSTISGVGRELFTHSADPEGYLTSWTNEGSQGGVTKTTNYHAFAVGWSSPIVLDLSGTGKLDASGGKWLPHNAFVPGAKTAMFDIEGNGFESLVEWVGPNAGLLVMPGETNITVNSLFGNTGGYKDGYEKLASFDTNKDNKLSGNELNGFKVWIDNGDAKATTSELKSVASLGITEIAVTHKNYQSSFVQNGQRKYSWDWCPSAIAIEKVKVAAPK